MSIADIIPPNQNVMFHVDGDDRTGAQFKSALAAASKLYLVLYQSFPIDLDTKKDPEVIKDWEYVRGREAVYQSIVDRLNDEESGDTIDLLNSLVIVASYKRTIEEPITVYDFMKKMQVQKKIPECRLIDIDQYIDPDVYPELFTNESDSEKLYGQGNTNIPYTEQEAEYGGDV